MKVKVKLQAETGDQLHTLIAALRYIVKELSGDKIIKLQKKMIESSKAELDEFKSKYGIKPVVCKVSGEYEFNIETSPLQVQAVVRSIEKLIQEATAKGVIALIEDFKNDFVKRQYIKNIL